MGRSVEVPSHATETAYFTVHMHSDEDCKQLDYVCCCDFWDWSELEEYYFDWLESKFPSIERSDRFLSYPYRETKIIAENELAEFTLSGYGGIYALSVIPKDESEELFGLAENWCNKISLKDFENLKKLGTFSNGESIYETTERVK